MRGFIQKIREKIYDESIEFRDRLTRMSLIMVLLMIGIFSIVSIFTGQNIWIILVNGLVAVCIFIALLISYKQRRSYIATIILFVSVFVISLPVMYFAGGGIKSAAPQWYLLALVMTFILLELKHTIPVFVLGSASFITCIVTSYYHPEWVIEFSTDEEMITDIAVSTGFVILCIGVVISMHTNQYRIQQKKTEEQAKLVELASRSRDSFFANLSHEIRTPINTIIGLNEVIIREKASAETVENALNIQNASLSLLNLINDILDMSQIETGQMKIVDSRYSVDAMVTEIVEKCWPKTQEKQLLFKVDVAEDTPSALLGDAVRNRQIIENLIFHAINSTQEGEIVLTIRFEKTADNLGNLRVSIRDTGDGLKKDEIDNLVQMLSGKELEGKIIEGYGTGLSISSNLIKLMKGRINVDSIYTKGTTFTISIPQTILDWAPIGKQSYAVSSKTNTAKEYHQSFEAPRAKVLIVDDNLMNLAVATKLLADTKVIIDKAMSGEEALALTETTHYDVILMDHLMPGMDGIETLQNIRRQIGGQSINTPVIALTANLGDNAEEVYKSYGFQGFLAKPISVNLLEKTVFNFLPPELIEYSVSMDRGSDEQFDEMRAKIENEKLPFIISADCTSDIPEEYIQECGIRMMHYNVYIDDKKFRDGIEITSDNTSQLLAQGKEIISLPADVEEYEAFFGQLLTEAEQVIHFTIGKNTGVAYSVASDAARCFGNVHVVDSGTLTGGMGLIAMAAAEELKKGSSVDYILGYIETAKRKTSTSFLIQDVRNMYQTRKIGAFTYGLCKSFFAKPIIVMRESAINVGGIRFGGFNKSAKSYIKKVFRKRDDINTKVLVINYVGLPVKDREMIKKEVSKYIHFETIIEEPASATIALYCGMNVFSFSYFKK